MYQQYLKVMPSRTGNGVFTSIKIPMNSPIIEIIGELFTSNNLPDHPAILQIGYDLFIGPSGGTDDYINHSCNPNCYLDIVGNRAILYSLHVILPESEITFDYSTSSTDTLDKWNMICNCGTVGCRKIISGLHYLKPNIINDYKQRNMIPLFMKENIFKKDIR